MNDDFDTDDSTFPETRTPARREPAAMPVAELLRRVPMPVRRWKNPSHLPVRMTFGAEAHWPMRGAEMVLVEIPPGGEADIPRMWDRAIVRVHDGVIIGGMCPHLVPVETRWPHDLDPALKDANPHFAPVGGAR